MTKRKRPRESDPTTEAADKVEDAWQDKVEAGQAATPPREPVVWEEPVELAWEGAVAVDDEPPFEGEIVASATGEDSTPTLTLPAKELQAALEPAQAPAKAAKEPKPPKAERHEHTAQERRESVLAELDEMLGRCGDGSSVGLIELTALRKRVEAL